jgi:hypothetical protein
MNDVRLIRPTGTIEFRETPGETSHVQALLGAWWKTFSANRPFLFNGPILACRACEHCDIAAIRISWYATNYAHYMQRATPSPVAAPARAIFCSVAARVRSGRLLAGQMARNTSSPKRLQLPGGNITLGHSGIVSVGTCALDACKEFEEEVGVDLDPAQLEPWRIKVGGSFDDLGIIYACDLGLTEDDVRATFQSHAHAERKMGRAAELEDVLFVDAHFDASMTTYDYVDYLPAVIREFTRRP